ncbi:MAG: hypothetical protein HY791_06130 [Deltaproteobacteria bacterium]|nr:hypothetical protein [Deltaproteobacteria bacterium]
MSKQAISVTLDQNNLLWIKGQMKVRGTRSVSETIDDILSAARRSPGQVTSVVGTVRIPDDDPELLSANAELRQWFASSLSRGERRAATRKQTRA